MTLVETRQVAVFAWQSSQGPWLFPTSLACVQVGSKLDPHPTRGKGDRKRSTLPFPLGTAVDVAQGTLSVHHQFLFLREQPQMQCSSGGQYQPQRLSLGRIGSSEWGQRAANNLCHKG